MRADLALSEVSCCGRVNRRVFWLTWDGIYGTGPGSDAPARWDCLANTSEVWTPPDGKPHFTPKAKSVIWIFHAGRRQPCRNL